MENMTDQVGLSIFKNIFEIAPEAISLFPFRNDADLDKSEALKNHYTKVVQALDGAVTHASELHTIQDELK